MSKLSRNGISLASNTIVGFRFQKSLENAIFFLYMIIYINDYIKKNTKNIVPTFKKYDIIYMEEELYLFLEISFHRKNKKIIKEKANVYKNF